MHKYKYIYLIFEIVRKLGDMGFNAKIYRIQHSFPLDSRGSICKRVHNLQPDSWNWCNHFNFCLFGLHLYLPALAALSKSMSQWRIRETQLMGQKNPQVFKDPPSLQRLVQTPLASMTLSNVRVPCLQALGLWRTGLYIVLLFLLTTRCATLLQ